MSRGAARNKLHVLDLGAVQVDENFIIASATIVTASRPDAVSRLIDVPISAYLIECAGGNVLYDTGCHPDCMGPNGRWTQKHQEIGPFIGGDECTLPSRLKALGLTPDDIPFVVLSHLHNDHAGCIEFFCQSKLIVHEDEFAGALRHYALHDNATNYVLQDIAAWLDKPRQWDLVRRGEERREIVRGVELFNFGSGHAYGMLGAAGLSAGVRRLLLRRQLGAIRPAGRHHLRHARL
jgi:glyoxylase-like metal-dependent hydrolase (beta-lactamase superfamily II)